MVTSDWDYNQKSQYKGDVIKVKSAPKRGRKVSYKETAIKEATRILDLLHS